MPIKLYYLLLDLWEEIELDYKKNEFPQKKIP